MIGTLILLALAVPPTVWAVRLVLAVDEAAYARAVEGTRRYVDLTAEARAELAAAPRLPLFDPEGAAAAGEAIDRYLALKARAHKELS